ncbi:MULTISPECIES: dihydrolipoamide acetyltransferase family protein [Mycolicibacterium]|uniref:dihydrolipoamide acetyltransferase family protein n=1 Tax=Mycolicibacterium TaxID=1866885 RepID=UPI0011D666D3|nr:dihydrolipoamide acetyltransferase family protein [Mycolicibacterium mageritense]TXI53310.1 MAG: 2-oxo acid dehydrogenase subunit E2 [Mycolicibacterium mageritense]
MPTLLRMPGIAADTATAILSEWQVQENIPYQKDDALATVETDKALVEIEAEEAGVILGLLVQAGTEVQIGAPIAVTGVVGEAVDDLDAVLRQLGVGATETAGRQDGPQSAPTTGRRLFATPLVRRLAQEAELDLHTIEGSGPGGRIVRRDVERILAERAEPAPVAVVAAPPEHSPQPHAEQQGYVDEPHSRIRRAIASRLAESKRIAPHFYVRATCRVDALLALRATLNSAGGQKVSVNDLVVKAAARAHTLVPAMNVVWNDDAIRRYQQVDIAVAVASPRGLVTPVVRDVARRSISAVAAELGELAGRARDGKLGQHEIEGGAFCVSNLGMYGTEEFAAIINPPQSAILAVGAARQEPVVDDGALAVGTVMRVTLSVDHRPIDGSTAAEWMRAFVGVVENPVQILA